MGWASTAKLIVIHCASKLNPGKRAAIAVPLFAMPRSAAVNLRRDGGLGRRKKERQANKPKQSPKP